MAADLTDRERKMLRIFGAKLAERTAFAYSDAESDRMNVSRQGALMGAAKFASRLCGEAGLPESKTLPAFMDAFSTAFDKAVRELTGESPEYFR